MLMPDPKDLHLNKYRMGIAEDYPYLDMADDDVLAEVMRIKIDAPGEWFEWGRNEPALRRIQQWLRGAETHYATETADFIEAKLAELKQFDTKKPKKGEN
jgi:hypothetical protein